MKENTKLRAQKREGGKELIEKSFHDTKSPGD